MFHRLTKKTASNRSLRRSRPISATLVAASVLVATGLGACSSERVTTKAAEPTPTSVQGPAAPGNTEPTPSSAQEPATSSEAQPGATRYVDITFPEITATTDVTYATAPALGTGTTTALKMDWYAPKGDTLTERPLIVWVHGGGFVGGTRTKITSVAEEWAKRGYVTVSIDYRVDSGNQCQAIQDGLITDPAAMERETTRCFNAIATAQQDTHAAIRWARANASTLKIDTTKVAVGGFSAGALTAVNVAQGAEKPGTIGDYDTQDSRVSAALAASGCNYDLPTIGTGDAPIFLLASEFDRSVDFTCVTETETGTKAKGLTVETEYYYGEGTHGFGLYKKHKAATDAAWSSFLIRHLGL